MAVSPKNVAVSIALFFVYYKISLGTKPTTVGPHEWAVGLVHRVL